MENIKELALKAVGKIRSSWGFGFFTAKSSKKAVSDLEILLKREHVTDEEIVAAFETACSNIKLQKRNESGRSFIAIAERFIEQAEEIFILQEQEVFFAEEPQAEKKDLPTPTELTEAAEHHSHAKILLGTASLENFEKYKKMALENMQLREVGLSTEHLANQNWFDSEAHVDALIKYAVEEKPTIPIEKVLAAIHGLRRDQIISLFALREYGLTRKILREYSRFNFAPYGCFRSAGEHELKQFMKGHHQEIDIRSAIELLTTWLSTERYGNFYRLDYGSVDIELILTLRKKGMKVEFLSGREFLKSKDKLKQLYFLIDEDKQDPRVAVTILEEDHNIYQTLTKKQKEVYDQINSGTYLCPGSRLRIKASDLKDQDWIDELKRSDFWKIFPNFYRLTNSIRTIDSKEAITALKELFSLQANGEKRKVFPFDENDENTLLDGLIPLLQSKPEGISIKEAVERVASMQPDEIRKIISDQTYLDRAYLWPDMQVTTVSDEVATHPVPKF